MLLFLIQVIVGHPYFEANDSHLHLVEIEYILFPHFRQDFNDARKNREYDVSHSSKLRKD